MSAAIHGIDEGGVESEVIDGSDFPILIDSISEKSSDVTLVSAGGASNDQLLGNSDDENGDIFSDAPSPSNTIVPEMLSDREKVIQVKPLLRRIW